MLICPESVCSSNQLIGKDVDIEEPVVFWQGHKVQEKTQVTTFIGLPMTSSIEDSLVVQNLGPSIRYSDRIMPLDHDGHEVGTIACSDTSSESDIKGSVSFEGTADTSGNAGVGVEVNVGDKDGNISGSVSGNADTRGNAGVGVEISVQDSDKGASGSVSGSVHRDPSGNTHGEVKIKGQIDY